MPACSEMARGGEHLGALHGAWCTAWCMVHGALHGAWCVRVRVRLVGVRQEQLIQCLPAAEIAEIVVGICGVCEIAERIG